MYFRTPVARTVCGVWSACLHALLPQEFQTPINCWRKSIPSARCRHRSELPSSLSTWHRLPITMFYCMMINVCRSTSTSFHACQVNKKQFRLLSGNMISSIDGLVYRYCSIDISLVCILIIVPEAFLRFFYLVNWTEVILSVRWRHGPCLTSQ